MQFTITGIEQASNSRRQVTIDAPTPEHARRQAEALGIRIERVEHYAGRAEQTHDRHAGRAPGHPYNHTGSPSDRYWHPGIAALLSFIIPGAGQIYRTRILSGLLWFVAVPIGYFFLIIPGVVLHIACIVCAAAGNPYRPR